VVDLEERRLSNIYYTISRFLQFTLLPGAFINSQAKIRGPLPISTYMRQCLSHPRHGFYMNPENIIFGSRRNLTTSPEIRQMFGEVWPGAILESEIER
jgi:NADH dehydrogenase [ubiquinone] 1 alpha subcomplex assembly factor 7